MNAKSNCLEVLFQELYENIYRGRKIGAGTDQVERLDAFTIIIMINWFYAAHNVLSLLVMNHYE